MDTTLEESNDYRDMLRSYYERRKSDMPLYSYRMMGQKMNLDASQLFRILQKEQHLPTRCVPIAKEMLGLQGRSAEHFELLMAASRSRSSAKRKEFLDKAFALRDVQRRNLEDKELEFLGHWYHAAIRSLIEVSRGQAEPRELAARLVPPITEPMAVDSLRLLKDIGLIKKQPSGRFSLAETHITASGPEKARAVHSFQKQLLDLAADSLTNIPKTHRDISTLTLSVDADCFEDLRGMLQEFRRLVQKRVEECSNPDRVMQLTLAFHPLAFSQSEGK
jgi:uncharacterized protein (TIGR02147 family)